MNLKHLYFPALVCLAIITGPAYAATENTSSFLKQFIQNYESQAFEQQVTLVKESQEVIPGAIDELVNRGMVGQVTFEERMWFLNIASALAYMHLHWHEDDQPLKKVEPIIKDELQKEQARLAILMKWKKEERFIGNFVMKKNLNRMEEMGLPAVLYPHWQHRIMYECKVCHDSIFVMKRWENNLSQQAIADGKQCGTCHNGTDAFSATDENSCKRCHIVGEPEAEHLHNPNLVKQEAIQKAAQSVGASWHPEKLKDGRLPLDRFQFIDWLELKKLKAFSPVTSLSDSSPSETRDNLIVFESQSDFVNDVIFDHKVHSDWINCSSCHPALFTENLGENKIKMTDISKGRFCGHCHGKVSFTFADCLRCHKKTTGKLSADTSRTENVLRRTKH